MNDGQLNELDIAILRTLPDEGAKLGKYLADARTAKQIQRALDDEYVTSMLVGRSLTEMRKADLVVMITDRSGQKGAASWQRSHAGKKRANEQGGEEDST